MQKNKIKTMMARSQGFRVKNPIDQQKFAEREKTILNLPVGYQFTINQQREDGSFGYEYRDVCNMLVCKGKLKIIIVPKKDDVPEYKMYERIDNKPCQYLLDDDKLIISHCGTCQTDYDKSVTRCTKCIFKNNTKNGKKGEGFPLKQKLNNNDTCQLYRGRFKKDSEKDEDDEDEDFDEDFDNNDSDDKFI